MKKSREFRWVKFDAETIRKAIGVFLPLLGYSLDGPMQPYVKVEHDVHAWKYDTLEEMLAEYRSDFVSASIHYYVMAPKSEDGTLRWGESPGEFNFDCYLQPHDTPYPYTTVEISLPTAADIERVLAVFEDAAEASRIEEPPWEAQVTVFIGHGGSPLWNELDRHLRGQHGFKTEAYELGARAGHTVRDVLETMLTQSSFAVLVMTGENEGVDGEMHARENVIHEAGLFQGRLGFPKAVILLEEGCSEFSNISGLNQIRFHRGNIRETFGDVLGVIRREFAPGESG